MYRSTRLGYVYDLPLVQQKPSMASSLVVRVWIGGTWRSPSTSCFSCHVPTRRCCLPAMSEDMKTSQPANISRDGEKIVVRTLSVLTRTGYGIL